MRSNVISIAIIDSNSLKKLAVKARPRFTEI